MCIASRFRKSVTFPDVLSKIGLWDSAVDAKPITITWDQSKVDFIRKDPDYYVCYKISLNDIIWSKRGDQPIYLHHKYLVEAWNNKSNTNLNMVA